MSIEGVAIRRFHQPRLNAGWSGAATAVDAWGYPPDMTGTRTGTLHPGCAEAQLTNPLEWSAQEFWMSLMSSGTDPFDCGPWDGTGHSTITTHGAGGRYSRVQFGQTASKRQCQCLINTRASPCVLNISRSSRSCRSLPSKLSR